MLTSDPFMARPIGERAAETMTASGMTVPSKAMRARVTKGGTPTPTG
jgi:hypothetical protein